MSNSLKKNVATLRKIVKNKCPSVSVRTGKGTVYGWAQITSRDRGAPFTLSEKRCLRGLGLNPGSNWLPIPPDKVRTFIKKKKG
ncbi:hypothetical protein ES702_00578 [subsurface metagenome]